MAAVTERQQAEYITSPRETKALLDEMARRYLGVPYAEFLRRFES